MPFIFETQTKQALESFATSSSANTELDQAFLKPGATRPAIVVALRVQGKAAAKTSLSGISIRLKQWPTTSSASTTTAASGSTSTTPTPKIQYGIACVATAGMITASTNVVVVGTGTAVYVGLATCGASGPGGWVAINPDDVPSLTGGSNMSLDIVSASAEAAALGYEFALDHMEG